MARRKLKAITASPNHYNEQRDKEENEAAQADFMEMKFLKMKAESNPLSAGYCNQMMDLLFDLTMLELAQRSAEAMIKTFTKNKTIEVDDSVLTPFRVEMEKAKAIKLTTGVLSLSGAFNTEEAVSLLTQSLYGVKQSNEKKQVDSLKEILDSYVKKLEKLSKGEIK